MDAVNVARQDIRKNLPLVIAVIILGCDGSASCVIVLTGPIDAMMIEETREMMRSKRKDEIKQEGFEVFEL